MNYKSLNIKTWENLKSTGDLASGYQSIWLSVQDRVESNLHIFKDRTGYSHFAIEATNINKYDIEIPNVNGLQVLLISYKFNNGKVSQFIDIICNISGYLEEFTEVVKEIAKAILENGESPLDAVNQTISSWISFWSRQRRELLSEEELVGLICELLILNNLCKINPNIALKSWAGPLGEKHDFNFTDWTIEVKGTRKAERTHIINGIDQLKPYKDKQMAFVSFLVAKSDNVNSVNLPVLIESLVKNFFKKQPELTIRFNELLSEGGYNPIHSEEYKKFNVEIAESTFFEVNEDFPKLTSEMINQPLSNRISAVKYNITLDGMAGIDLSNLSWGNYFY